MEIITDGFSWLTDPANWSGSNGVPIRVWEHLQLSLIALTIATVIAVPLGLAIGHTGRGRFISVQVANIGRSVPSLAILGLVFLIAVERVPALAFGSLPTIVALAALGIPVILINTYVGIDQVDRETVEAARGMGMSGMQVLRRLEVPLATPLIMTGLRLAAVQIVATAGLAALIAGGGLGRYVIDGFYQRENDRMVAGAILIAAISVLTDLVFTLLARLAAPRLTSGSKGSGKIPA
ncbi:MAG: ABC transporter permease [Actinomycetota bacterium]|nr:ABC transporter permease [Actinomycetota bacterium]MDH5224067.1 ABC transporter permease [Actinomycetota bacterium]MDH5314303.1 ABC transporter permease [Actinomycetota bacterium]